jgi:hypothetical protein
VLRALDALGIRLNIGTSDGCDRATASPVDIDAIVNSALKEKAKQ